MSEERNHCLDHSGLVGRFNLLIALMLGSLSGIVALFVVCINIYFTMTGRLADLEKQVALNSRTISQLESSHQHVREKLERLEVNSR